MSGPSINGHPVREDGTVDDSGMELEQAIMRGGPLDGVELQVRERLQGVAFASHPEGHYLRMPRSADPAVFYWSTHMEKPGMNPRTLAWGCALGALFWTLVALAWALWVH